MPLVPDFDFELSLIPPNSRYLLGLDEVGRGPWAGPVTVGAFLIDLNHFSPLEFTHQKVRDSKTLSALQRQHQLAYFQTANFTFQTFSADSTQIDRQGIGPVITTLFTQALTFFHGRFDFAIIDGNLDIFSSSSLKRGLKGISLPKADTLCFSVAAASIVAKVDRDTQMIAAHSLYPIYGFNQNMGYGTALHHQGLKTHGPCPLHRRSYKPISQYL